MRPAAAKIRQWRADPVSFARECLKMEPDAWAADFLTAFPRHQRICLKGSKGIGKSAVVAAAIWNYMLTRRHPKVVATSISGDNLRDGLWTELAKWQQRSPLLKEVFDWSAERITAKDHPETWWASARQWSKSANPAQQADTLAGIHADNVLFVLEEAGGIPDGVAAAAEAGLTTGGDTKLLMDGNPTHLSGPLYRACTTERHLWKIFEVSGDPDDPKRSPRVSIQWAREQIEKYGRDNPYVLVNVFGQFPPAQSNALLGVEEIGAAAKRSITEAEWLYEARILGVDVARFGDDESVIFPRQGRAAMRPQVLRNLDTIQLAGQVALAISKFKPHAVFVDQTGIGAGVVDQLQNTGHTMVTGIDFGMRPHKAEPKFLNRRMEMWWELAHWIRNGGCIPDDAELRSQLVAPTYDFDNSGRLRLESKERMKERGLPSPDRADALALTFAMPVMAPALASLNQQGRAVTEYQVLGGHQGERAVTDYNVGVM